MCVDFFVVFFFKQKTAYEMRISDWSSDVCSSDLAVVRREAGSAAGETFDHTALDVDHLAAEQHPQVVVQRRSQRRTHSLDRVAVRLARQPHRPAEDRKRVV